MPLYLGLDCGGSTTRALAVDEQGTIVHQGRSGPANLASTPRETLMAHLLEALEGCPKPDAVAGCFAGLLTSADRDEATQMIEGISGAELGGAYPDYEAALAIASQSSHGLVIAGTGALVCSRKDGRTLKTGGGGPMIGDEGSVFSICRRAIWLTLVSAVAMPASDGFWAALEDIYHTRQPNEVLASFYRRPSPPKDASRLAPAVLADYNAGWDYAVSSVEQPLAVLAREVQAHFSALHPELQVIRLSLSGGLWDICPNMEPFFVSLLSEDGRVWNTEGLQADPVQGAVLLAQALKS